eukprot:TRINITY_DN4400_c0_g1_i1.p1 TRINITY_DN4400_c0_g1~~TRINITY_DN4400_c0_g1_i1.p1  ORF type:complete len:334 (+),score=89.66 TRINITY_DN4400_c0_g1_i1:60-1061(+)
MQTIWALTVIAASACAFHTDSNSFTALLNGDWGGSDHSPYTEPGQVDCSHGMNAVAADIKPDAVFLLGDNFYSSGIHGDEHDARFKETFEDVYTGEHIADLPYYVVAGNHDHKGNVSAQIAYSGLSPRWNYESLYYTESFNFAKSNGDTASVDVIFIDTVLLAGNSDDLDDKFGQLPGPADVAAAESQWKFIETSLANSKADYVFTAGHYPVWSGCSHGPTDILVAVLKPMLEKYNASGHISGHDHCLEHMDEGKGPVYALAGAGDNCCYSNTNAHRLPEGSLKFAIWNDGTGSPINGGFGSMIATEEQLVFNYYASNGTKLFTSEPVLPRRR